MFGWLGGKSVKTLSQKFFSIALFALVIAGCGGGGSDAPVAVPATITMQNAPAIAGEVSASALESGDLGDLLGAGGFVANVGPGLSKVARAAVDSKVSAIASQAGGAETIPCTVSGSITISATIADPNTLSPGDSISAQFSMCDDGSGVVSNGSFQFVINEFGGDLAAGDFNLDVTLIVTNFQVIENGETSSLDGDVSVSLSTSQGIAAAVTVSGSSLTVSDGTSTATLGSFSTTVGGDGVTYTVDSQGTLNASDFEGQVTYDTPVVFQGTGEEYPFTGELLITGANDATIRLIALDSQNVRLELDLDGDGAVDEIIDTTWVAIDD